MIYLHDEQVRQHLSLAGAREVLRTAFIAHAQGRASLLPRTRCGATGRALCTLGAVVPDAGVMGAKLYATAAAGTRSYINILSARSGRLRAVLEADSLTTFRTAALTSLAAETVADPGCETLAVFGCGVQAWAHVLALCAVLPMLRQVLVVGLSDAEASTFAERVRTRLGMEAELARPERALLTARLVVTATRARTPLFDGSLVQPGTFVAAIGANHPQARELDETLMRRAARLVVECREQSLADAGELALLPAAVRTALPTIELGELLENPSHQRLAPEQIVVYKSVGVGLADVALAQHVLVQRARGDSPADAFLGTYPPAPPRPA